MKLLARADVVIALGSRLGPFGTLPQYDIDYWPTGAKLIQVDANPKVLGLSKRVDVASAADAKEFATELLKLLKAKNPEPRPNLSRLGEIEEARATWNAELAKWSADSRGLMHPRRFLEELAKAMPRNAIVATDIGNNCSMANSYFKFGGPRQHLSALSWGNCGFAYGAALGAKVGRPDTPVFALQGDGAYGISGLSEVMTAVRENIPVVAVVFQNYEWGAEKKNQIDYYDNRFVGANLRENPSYAELAEVMGAKGYRVESPNEVGDAVTAAVESEKPCVIEAVIQGGEEVLAEPFRRDALKMPQRYLPKYEHLIVE